MAFFEWLYAFGIDFNVFGALRQYFNAELFQSFFLVALGCAFAFTLIYYVIALLSAPFTKILYWLIALLIASFTAALITYYYNWAKVGTAIIKFKDQSNVVRAINEGMLKYSFIDNLLITAILFFIFSLIFKNITSSTAYTPFKIFKNGWL